MGYMSPQEQLQTQYFCAWSYKHGAGRVQTSISLAPCLFTYFYGGVLDSNVISVDLSGQVRRLTCDDSGIKHESWRSIQIKPNEIFQLLHNSTQCRTLKVIKNKYTVTPRAAADKPRQFPALTKVTGGVLVIAGYVPGTDVTPTVSRYDITTDTWEGLSQQMNIARNQHSACNIKGTVYIFCGFGDQKLGN